MMCFAFSQSFDGFIRYLEQQRSTNFLCSMSDFHLLLFLYTTDVVQLQVDLEYTPVFIGYCCWATVTVFAAASPAIAVLCH